MVVTELTLLGTYYLLGTVIPGPIEELQAIPEMRLRSQNIASYPVNFWDFGQDWRIPIQARACTRK